MLRRAFCLLVMLTVPGLYAQTPPPPTPKKPVTDTYDKVTVNDDYRWLEDFDDPAVKQWAAAQNTAARAALDTLPDRDAISRHFLRRFRVHERIDARRH